MSTNAVFGFFLITFDFWIFSAFHDLSCLDPNGWQVGEEAMK